MIPHSCIKGWKNEEGGRLVVVIISPLEFIAGSSGNRDHLHRGREAAFNQ